MLYFLLSIIDGDLRSAELLQTDRSGELNGGGVLEVLVVWRLAPSSVVLLRVPAGVLHSMVNLAPSDASCPLGYDLPWGLDVARPALV